MATGAIMRVLADSKRKDENLSDSRGMALFYHRGDDVTLQIGLAVNGIYQLSTDIGTLWVSIKPAVSDDTTTPLYEDDFSSGDCDATYTGEADWRAGDKQLIEIDIPRASAAFDLTDDAATEFRLIIVHEDASGNRTTHADTLFTIHPARWENPSIVTPPTPSAEYYTKTESDAKFETITDATTHKSDTTNPHSVTATQVGLGNVNNTSDADKPVSTAQASDIYEAGNNSNSHGSLGERLEEVERKLNLKQIGTLPQALAKYEATSIRGVADGAEVTSWLDESGHGRHATATGGTAPTFDADDGNGMPALNFDGTEFVDLPSTVQLTDDLTIIAVFSRANATGFNHQTILGQKDLSGSLFLQAYGTTIDAIVSDGGTGTVPAGRFVYRGQNASVANNRPQLVTYRRNGSDIQNGKSDFLPLNATGIAPIDIAVSANGPLEIGRRGATSGEYLTGKIYALHIYPALSDEEVYQVQAHLGRKYQGYLGESLYAEYKATYDLGFSSGWLVQAITRGDNGIYYVSFNKIVGGGDAYVRKYSRDEDGEFVLISEHNLTSELPVHATYDDASQMNGLDYRAGYLYVGANNWTSPNGSQANPYGWILKYRASDMTLVQVSDPIAGLSEGGAWLRTVNGWRFFNVNHDDFNAAELDENLELVTTHTYPQQGQPSNGLYFQSNLFMIAEDGGTYSIKPTHNGGTQNKFEAHKWTGSGFVSGQRMDTMVFYPGSLIGLSGQGLCWDRPPGTYPKEGGSVLLARRNGNGEILEGFIGRRFTSTNTVAN